MLLILTRGKWSERELAAIVSRIGRAYANTEQRSHGAKRGRGLHGLFPRVRGLLARGSVRGDGPRGRFRVDVRAGNRIWPGPLTATSWPSTGRRPRLAGKVIHCRRGDHRVPGHDRGQGLVRQSSLPGGSEASPRRIQGQGPLYRRPVSPALRYSRRSHSGAYALQRHCYVNFCWTGGSHKRMSCAAHETWRAHVSCRQMLKAPARIAR